MSPGDTGPGRQRTALRPEKGLIAYDHPGKSGFISRQADWSLGAGADGAITSPIRWPTSDGTDPGGPSRSCRSSSARSIRELEDELSAARESLRRVIRDTNRDC